MKNINITVLLLLLSLLSLFTGISINNNFSFLYEYTFIDGPQMVYRAIELNSVAWGMITHLMFLIIVHLTVLFLPLLYYKTKSSKLLFYVPLAFIICQFFTLAIFIFILIPFIIIWILVMLLAKNTI